MVIRKGTIVLSRSSDGWDGTNYRVESVDGSTVLMRSLKDYRLAKENAEELKVLYQTNTFSPGDTVRIRPDYVAKYNEVDGENNLTVVTQLDGKALTTRVRNNDGVDFNVLNERLYLVRPAKAFKAGDRVVVDFELAEKYDGDGTTRHWNDSGVMVLTEDSGSRAVQTTSHVRYEKDESFANNVPTRWLKLYEEPAKRVVGETIKAEDIKVGDKVIAVFEHLGISYTYTGVVASKTPYFNDSLMTTEEGGQFPNENRGAVFTLLEEAPEPVDENLQRLLDAEVGEIAHGTYADEYWKKTGDDEWRLLELDSNLIRATDQVFDSLCKIKYGKLEIYRKAEDAD